MGIAFVGIFFPMKRSDYDNNKHSLSMQDPRGKAS
jgi:hypothetical protein